jgi:hypothetical protein
LADQSQRWRCRCGTSFSWYEKTCRHCDSQLGSYGQRPGKADADQ